MGKRTTFSVAAVFAAGFIATGSASGQACIGVPIPPGSYGGQADVSFGDGSTTYGASVTRNLAGPLSVGGGYGLTIGGGASNAHDVSGRVAFGLPGLPLSLCPVTGFRYRSESVGDEPGSLTASSLTVPIGIALAHPFPVSPAVSLTPYLTPHLAVRIASGTVEEGQGDSATGFGLSKGLVLGVQRFFGGVDVEFIRPLGGSDPVIRVTFGMRV